jgi:hypothetical protein
VLEDQISTIEIQNMQLFIERDDSKEAGRGCLRPLAGFAKPFVQETCTTSESSLKS